MLYAFSRRQWQKVGKYEQDAWNDVEICIGKYGFEARVNEQRAEFENMIVAPNARLYLADGFESEHLPNNIDALFYIDMKSVSTSVIKTTKE